MARRKNKHRRKAAKPAAAKMVSVADAAAASPSPARFAFLGHRFPLPTTLPALALCALIVAAFFPASGAGFIWDDYAFTAAKPVQSWTGLWQIWFEPRTLTKTSEVHYWPLLYTTFWLEHKLWGVDHPLGFHFVNLGLHATATVVLWRLLVRMAVPGAWFAAAVFAVHPVHTEPVVWVIGRKDVLAAVFFLASASLYIRFVENRRGRRDYIVSIALFTLGLLSKSTVVTLPAALLLWHWWKQGRVTAADGMRMLPFAILGFLLTLADWSYYTSLEVLSLGYSFVERAQIAATALWFYAGKLLWPTKLAVIYPHFTVGDGDPWAWMYLIAAVALALALWFGRRRITRGPFACAMFFAVTLSPSLGFLDYGYMQFSFVADRYQYLAAAGVITLLTAGVADGIGRLPGAWRKAAPVGAALALLSLTVFSWNQAHIYKDEGAFFAHIIAHNPQARGAYHNYGDWFLEQGRLEEARDAYATAGRQRPESFSAANDLAVVFEKLGQPAKAEAQYRRALRLKPRNKVIINNLALLLTRQQRFDDALAMVQQLTAINPKNAKAHLQTGDALFNLKRFDEALRSYDRALELDPSSSAAQRKREQALRMVGSNTGKGGE